MIRKILKLSGNAATLALTIAAAALLWYAVSGTPVIARVEGASMEPGYSSGDTYLCAPGWSVGETAVLDDPTRSRVLIKRVIAEGPCRVSWDEDGTISVDGVGLNEPYAAYGHGKAGECDVPAGCLFVAGDNRSVSYDSRSFGAVSENLVHGRPVLLVMRGGQEKDTKGGNEDAPNP